MYKTVTHDIAVSVEPFYLEDQSEPGHHVWAYRVTVTNRSARKVQLVARHWRITDALFRTEEVRGAGVVGEQPHLEPGDSYQYTSQCPLRTSSGSMVGTYLMATDGGDQFEIDIPAFSLDIPGARSSIN